MARLKSYEPGWQQQGHIPENPFGPGGTIKMPQLNIACKHSFKGVGKLTISRHDPGHTFVCVCGQEFVVALDRRNRKVLVQKND